jgi:hypothetical protein
VGWLVVAAPPVVGFWKTLMMMGKKPVEPKPKVWPKPKEHTQDPNSTLFIVLLR